jgi:hypothetical protein
MIAFDRLMIVYDRKWNAKKRKEHTRPIANNLQKRATSVPALIDNNWQALLMCFTRVKLI